MTQELSNLWLTSNSNQTAFLYLTKNEDWLVASPLTWLPAKFSANSREQAEAVMEAIKLLSNHYDPYH